ncbi:MAG: glycosyltransferase family 2 protein [Parabacteroides sp.]|nr:glycosyltransferase family 2 protein [Parabacteroides sp.]
MTVSVVIATYRRDESLKRTIESVKSQTYTDIEIIVVDDNAEAEWNQKVNNIVAEFSKIQYIRNVINKGSAETRNVGIYAAKGEYITFLDDDDVYLKEKVAHQLAATIQANADFSITDLFLYDENNKLVDQRIRYYIKQTDAKSLLKYHLMHHITGTDAMMFKREYLLKIGCFAPVDVGDEFFLMERAIKGCGVFTYIPGCYIKAYIHTETNGLSSGQRKIDGENALYDYKKASFIILNKKSIRYIKMRHYAVLAFTYLRQKRMVKFLGACIYSFLCAPISCIRFLKQH